LTEDGISAELNSLCVHSLRATAVTNALSHEADNRQGPDWLGTPTSLSLALVVSFLALAVSTLTAWLTLLRRGEIRMTLPTLIYFGPDGGSRAEAPPEKGFLRTLLYSTG